MAGTKGEEEIVDGRKEIGGRKRGNKGKDSHPAKRAKVEGEIAVDGTEEEEEEVNNKLERLRGLLADGPKKLSKKDAEEIINHLNVDEIMSLALQASQGKRSEDDGAKDKWTEDEEWDEKALKTVRVMLCCIELAEMADIRDLYEKWPTKAFATVLLSALDSYANRNLTDRMRMVKYYDIIPKLCSVLPWKLFAYVLNEKRVFGFVDVNDEEISHRQKKAAEMCDYCNGEGTHTGDYGTFCTLKYNIPKGTAVVPGYCIECSYCGFCDFSDSFEGCLECDCEVGQAVRIPPSLRNIIWSD